VSRRIKHLEGLIEKTLFTRIGNQINLTADGVEYLREVQSALQAFASLARPLSSGAQKRRLRVAAPPTFSRQLLVPRLSEFLTAHPDVELALSISIPLVDVKGADCDVEIRFGTGQYRGMSAVALLVEPVFPVCSPDYLRKLGKFEPAKPADLQRAVLLRSPLEPWRPWFDKIGVSWPEPSDGPQLNDLGMLMEAAVAGQGVALARRKLALRWLASGDLVRLSPQHAVSPCGYYLVHGAADETSGARDVFIDWLRKLDF
jgi:DNA-binding transcriptional LysR family regulator